MAAHVLQRSCPEVLNWIYSQVTLANCVSLGSCVKLSFLICLVKGLNEITVSQLLCPTLLGMAV